MQSCVFVRAAQLHDVVVFFASFKTEIQLNVRANEKRKGGGGCEGRGRGGGLGARHESAHTGAPGRTTERKGQGAAGRRLGLGLALTKMRSTARTTESTAFCMASLCMARAPGIVACKDSGGIPSLRMCDLGADDTRQRGNHGDEMRRRRALQQPDRSCFAQRGSDKVPRAGADRLPLHVVCVVREVARCACVPCRKEVSTSSVVGADLPKVL